MYCGYCVVQNGIHSGTLRAMSESVPARNIGKSENKLGKSRPDRLANAVEGEVQPAPGKPVKREIGGPEGPEPTRYGDWERKGRCIDF